MIRMNKAPLVCALFAVGGLLAFGLFTLTATQHAAGQENQKKDTPKPKSAGGEDKSEKTLLQRFMRAKLTLSDGILEGLVTEDFDQIKKDARAIVVLTLAAEWKVSNDEAYVQQSEEFRRAARQLAKMADEHNLDGAALTFTQLTMSCIECHRLLRKGPKGNEKAK